MSFAASHHRDVKRPQVGVVGDLAGHIAPFAQCQRGGDALGACGVLQVLQPLGPGGGAHQPQKDQDGRKRKVLAGGEKSCKSKGQTLGFKKRIRRNRQMDTYKHRPKIGVLVDVHVAQVHQQRCHAVEEAHDGHAHKELGWGGGVTHQVRGGDRAVADGGIAGDQGHLAQPGGRAQGENSEQRFSLRVGDRALGFSPEGVVEVGVEGLVGAVPAQHSHNVPPRETATASKSKDSCELRGHVEAKFQ